MAARAVRKRGRGDHRVPYGDGVTPFLSIIMAMDDDESSLPLSVSTKGGGGRGEDIGNHGVPRFLRVTTQVGWDRCGLP